MRLGYSWFYSRWSGTCQGRCADCLPSYFEFCALLVHNLTQLSILSMFRPTKLTMGNLVQVDNHKWAVWTGGKPKADWLSLADSAAKHDKTPFQRQFAKDTTTFEARCAGLSHQFSKGGNRNQLTYLRLLRSVVWTQSRTCPILPTPPRCQMS